MYQNATMPEASAVSRRLKEVRDRTRRKMGKLEGVED